MGRYEDILADLSELYAKLSENDDWEHEKPELFQAIMARISALEHELLVTAPVPTFPQIGDDAQPKAPRPTPTYRGYDIIDDVKDVYKNGKVQATYYGQFMEDAKVMRDHLSARGLTPDFASSPMAILGTLEEQVRKGGPKVDVLTIGTHGGPGFIDMGGSNLSVVTASDDFWRDLRNVLSPGASIVIIGCEFASGRIYEDETEWTDSGLEAMRKIAQITGATVYGATGKYKTGGAANFSITVEAEGQPTELSQGFLVVGHP